MSKETAQEIIMQEFLNDNILFQDEHGSYYGFDKILGKSIIQYTNECFKSVITTIDLGNIRINEYILDENKITYKSEMTISQEDLISCYNAVYRVA